MNSKAGFFVFLFLCSKMVFAQEGIPSSNVGSQPPSLTEPVAVPVNPQPATPNLWIRDASGNFVPAPSSHLVQPLVVGQPMEYEKKPRLGLVISGSVLFGSAYMTTVFVAAGIQDACGSGQTGVCDGKNWLLYLPVVGPFARLSGVDSSLGSLGLVFDGLTQAAGVGLFIAGFAAPVKVPVFSKAQVQILPTGQGFQLRGHF